MTTTTINRIRELIAAALEQMSKHEVDVLDAGTYGGDLPTGLHTLFLPTFVTDVAVPGYVRDLVWASQSGCCPGAVHCDPWAYTFLRDALRKCVHDHQNESADQYHGSEPEWELDDDPIVDDEEQDDDPMMEAEEQQEIIDRSWAILLESVGEVPIPEWLFGYRILDRPAVERVLIKFEMRTPECVERYARWSGAPLDLQADSQHASRANLVSWLSGLYQRMTTRELLMRIEEWDRANVLLKRGAIQAQQKAALPPDRT